MGNSEGDRKLERATVQSRTRLGRAPLQKIRTLVARPTQILRLEIPKNRIVAQNLQNRSDYPVIGHLDREGPSSEGQLVTTGAIVYIPQRG